LGGGPKTTTIGLAIFQALSYEYNIQVAVLLSIFQFLGCFTMILISQYYKKSIPSTLGIRKCSVWLNSRDSIFAKIGDGLIIMLTALLLLPPLVAVAFDGIHTGLYKVVISPMLKKAFLTSLHIALTASLCCIILTLMLIWTSRELKLKKYTLSIWAFDMVSVLILAIPSAALATGLFLLLSGNDLISTRSLVMITNALIAMPFAKQILELPMYSISKQYNPLCRSLGIKSLNRLWLVEIKILKKPLVQSLAITFVLSIGDLGIIAMFGDSDLLTIPLYLYQQLGSYRGNDSASTALVLLILCILVFSIIDKS
jgi:thiamine transport system permease protein